MAFPTTGILDAFTRADGDLGANYTGPIVNGTDDLTIVSNQATGTSVAICTDGYNVSTFGPDSEAYFDVPTRNGRINLYARLTALDTSTVDGYTITNDDAGNYQYYRIDNAGFTQLGATINDFAAYDGMGLEIIGSTLTAYRHTSGAWVALSTRTDATYGSAGYIGIRASDTTTRIDNFGGGTIGAAAGDITQPVRVRQQGVPTMSGYRDRPGKWN